MSRFLIVNADDFGLSEGTNTGILRACRDGIVTSASLMVHSPAAIHAVEHANGIDLGLHVDLGEWTYRDGAWSVVYERIPTSDATAVEDEVERQLELFGRLTGETPSHLDSHQHVHQHEPARAILRNVARRLGIPLRGLKPAKTSPRVPFIRYCGSFYGHAERGRPLPENIDEDFLVQLLRQLPDGITELGCHPGSDEQLPSSYRLERLQEVDVLTRPRIRQTLADERIQLTTFRELTVTLAGP